MGGWTLRGPHPPSDHIHPDRFCSLMRSRVTNAGPAPMRLGAHPASSKHAAPSPSAPSALSLSLASGAREWRYLPDDRRAAVHRLLPRNDRSAGGATCSLAQPRGVGLGFPQSPLPMDSDSLSICDRQIDHDFRYVDAGRLRCIDAGILPVARASLHAGLLVGEVAGFARRASKSPQDSSFNLTISHPSPVKR